MIEWRLQVCMAHAGVRFASQLHRRLVDVLGDAAPSEAHVSRLVRTPPERLNLTTLDALCVVLSCSPADLLQHHTTTDGSEGAS
ncbi:MAG: helix-turn-helix transcriptional regulator [Austwickia sp.]|nr:MAG: helix-turn-helix transcriptional regulator [Austwickia sp.]